MFGKRHEEKSERFEPGERWVFVCNSQLLATSYVLAAAILLHGSCIRAGESCRLKRVYYV